MCDPGTWVTVLSGDMGDTLSGMSLEGAMPWSVTRVQDEKLAFISDWLRDEAPIAELCRWYGISRNSGYELINRYKHEGADGLRERSRAPHSHPNAVTQEVAEALLAVRRRHPSWGAKKIRAWLVERQGSMCWPALSTINELLSRHGLTVHRPRRQRASPTPWPLRACAAGNDVWGADFKGWFRTADGARCDPFSLSDLHSRYVLRLQLVGRTDGEHVWPILEAAFREFGLPLAIRSDNGPPFAGMGVGGLSQLAIKLIKAGVFPERIKPGKPQQNGRHERLHRTLKAETANPPAANPRAQQRRFDAFRRYFNEERPHEALGQVTPATAYQPPRRSWNGRLREPEYDTEQIVRRVRTNGEIKWHGNLIFLRQALAGEPIGLAEIDAGHWRLSYGPFFLGTINPEGRINRPLRGHAPAADISPTLQA